uniref:Si:ch211-267e7.3 n=1 Tax=Salmo trutta TaxID=8032 RepID=A0A674B1H2_SALTR
MYCFWSARFGIILIHSAVFLFGTFERASTSNIKDSSDGREEVQRQSRHSQRHQSRGQQPDEVAQWWGEWSSWSTCSRTCGGGVRSQERHCLQQRLTATQNINSSFCVGSPKQYQLCPFQPCVSTSVSFKQQQCSQFNAKAFGRRHYEWVPLYPDDYISISNKPCDLQCTSTTGERQLLVPAHDGTYCRDGIYQGVCIEGQCQTVGCDGKLYSSKTVDTCGVCGGNGSSCYRVSGSHRKGSTQLGYVFITNIPVGATDIQIIERRKTENILALSDEAGHFFFNGNTIIDNPRNFRVAGTVFKYRRPANLLSDGFEYIIAQGPTDQGLNVMYYNLNGKMPHITYEYTVPRTPEARTTTPVASLPEEVQIRALSVVKPAVPEPWPPVVPDTIANATATELSLNDNEIEASEDYGKLGNHSGVLVPDEPPDVDHDLDHDHEGLVWELQAPLNLSQPPAMLVFRPASEIYHNNLENKLGDQGHPAPANYRTDSNLIDGESPGPNGTHRPSKPLHRSLFLDLVSEPGGFRQPCQDGSNLCPLLELNTSSSLDNSLAQLDIYPGRLNLHEATAEDSAPYGLLFEPEPNGTESSNLVNLHQVEPVQAPDTESNEFEVGLLDRDISLADMYRWKVSAYAPCSSTCTTGISTSYALCVRYDGSEVDEAYCDAVTRPEPTHEFCTGKECPPRWETSRWSECSRTCGEGFQFRTVRCWKMMAPGFDSSVYDELCVAAELQKPMARKACKSKGCGPQWEVSDWSECSARCGGRGLRSREVRCSMETRLCNESSRPLSEKECEGPPCDRRWTVSDWGPCSGACGEGRMTRYVACKNSNGNVISDGQCDLDLKPLAVYPCGDKNCPAHWVEQEWEQCNTTCGRGVKTRQVVCSGLEDGVFKEFHGQTCDSALKPEESSACFERPCSKWFTTSWSQCSKTCGSGVHVREVKCYQGEELGHSCDSALKPEAGQTCEVQACPTEAPVEEVCQDKATANCALVLKVKLCTHWYYRKACCQSCKSKAP